jgi:DNA polymerase elongation subunit (family B)
MNIKNMTNEEIENLDYGSLSPNVLNDVIRQLETEASIFKTQEQANKLVLNSIYGAMANRFSYFYDKDLAEAITIQGQDAIRYAETAVNYYFNNLFYKDKKLLLELQKIDKNININPEPCKKPAVIYIDTDSVHKDTIINTDEGSLTIEELYNLSNTSMGNTELGHESVSSDRKVLNWNNKLYYANIKRVIRHKVTKAKWELVTGLGRKNKSVIVTNDHSMIVFRDNIKLEVKPSEILLSDYVLTTNYTTCKFEKIKSIECIGDFEDEYVYDIEVDDETHTFIANDILVHNSCYITYEEIAEKINWTGSENDLVLTIDNFRLKEFLKNAFDKYAKRFNTESYLDFELETISRNGIWAQKKKYIQDISWMDGKIYQENEFIKTTGLEIIRSNIPSFCRTELVKLVKWIFNKGKNFTQRDITIELINLKKRFAIADIEDICFNTGIGDYEKYVSNDTDKVEVNDGCGAHVRGAAIYNHMLHCNPEYQNNYEKLKTNDKVKWYYVKSLNEKTNVFSYKRGSFPREFAPEVDIDTMFEKSIINPLNNIIGSIEGVDEIKGSLTIKSKLF